MLRRLNLWDTVAHDTACIQRSGKLWECFVQFSSKAIVVSYAADNAKTT